MSEMSHVLASVPALTVGAHDIEHVESLILLIGGGGVVVLLGLGAYFVVTNRGSRVPERRGSPARAEPTGLLAAASVVVVALLAVALRVGVARYVNDTVAPAGAVEIAATQSDSSWGFTYPNGTSDGDKVLVPAGRPILFDLSTDDDPASFFVPEFRVRAHVAPNSLGSVFVNTAEPGTAHILGQTGRAVAEIQVVPQAEFDEYMRVGPPNPYCKGDGPCPPELQAKWGAELYAQNACIGCHTRDGSKLVGPTFKGVYGRLETMTTGLQLHVDDDYIRESIRKPQAKIVKGFETAAMPSFANLSDRKVDALIAFLKTVK